MSDSFSRDFKRFFLRGLAVVLPMLATLILIIFGVNTVQKYIGKYVNAAVLWVTNLAWTLLTSPQTPHASQELSQRIEAFRQTYLTYFFWIGFMVALVAIYFLGRIMGSLLGRGIVRMLEQWMLRVPLFKQIYPYVKQVTDFLFSPGSSAMKFSRVVAVEYPRPGIWSLGLVTGPAMRTVNEKLGGEMLTVFVPSSPTPVTGYTIMVRRDMVIDLPLSIDDAVPFIISGGVLMPPGQKSADMNTQRALSGSQPQEDKKEMSE